MNETDLDLKEDFSGFTEVSVRDNMSQPTQLPPKIDVSEAVAQARASEPNSHYGMDDEGDGGGDGGGNGGGNGGGDGAEEYDSPQLPGVPRGIPPPEFMARPQQPIQQKPSFWQTLMSRGLIVLAIAAVGIFVWWWWSKNNNVAGPMEAAEAAVNAARKTVVEPIQKALKLPPLL